MLLESAKSTNRNNEPSPNRTEHATKKVEQKDRFVRTTAMLIMIVGLLVASMFYTHLNSLPTRALLGEYPDGSHSIFSDDALFYTVIAKNIVNNKTSTFDGEAFTNGYHPAWMLLNLPLVTLTRGNPEQHFRLSLQLSFAMHVFASISLAMALSLFCSHFFAVALAVLHLVGFPALQNVASGTEAPLSGLSTVLCLWVLMLFLAEWQVTTGNEVDKLSKRKSNRLALLLGFLLGFHFLARTDGIFLILSSLIVIIFFLLGKRKEGEPKSISAWLFATRIHLVIIMILLVTTPWLLFCLLKTGSIVQNSALMKQLWRESMLVGKPASECLAFGTSLFGRYIFNIAAIIPFGQLLFPIVLLIPLITTVSKRLRSKTWTHKYVSSLLLSGNTEQDTPATATTSGSIDKRDRFVRPALLAGLAGLTAVLVAGMYYAARFPHLRHWYYSVGYIVLLWLFAVAVASIQTRWCAKRQRGFAILKALFPSVCVLLIALSAWGSVARTLKISELGNGRNQDERYYDAALWCRDNLPQDARLAAFSSGILAAFSERKTVNLDGLVNADIQRHYRNRTLIDYIKERRIDYIVDKTYTLSYLDAYSPNWWKQNLEKVIEFPCDDHMGSVIVFKIRN